MERFARACAVCLVALAALMVGHARIAAREPAHWAYRSITRPALPAVRLGQWPRTAVDRFIVASLEAADLQPAPPADRALLARRLFLTLTGLPPTVDELDPFLADEGPDATERLVDRLLASPAYGERMALPWLDLARYADTHGYHADTHREMWRWREWVIEAFNRNLPFDQFSIEQLAGDLLPYPTLDQRIATGFQRNHMIIFENGVIAEEYRIEYVADRTNTFGAVWLAQTLQCARCHDHKHDPITQRDYYQLSAFFNNVPENGLDGQFGNAVPFIDAPTQAQQDSIQQLRSRLASLERTIEARLSTADANQTAWEEAARRQQPALVRPPTDMTLHLRCNDEDGNEVINSAAQGSAPKALAIQGEPSWIATRDGRALLLNGETWIDAGETGPFDRDSAATISLLAFPTIEGPLSIASRSADDNDRRGWDVALVDGRVRVRLTHTAGSDELIVSTQRKLPLRKWQRIMVVYDGRSRAAGIEILVDGQREKLTIECDQLASSIRVGGSLRLGRNTSGDGFRGMIRDFRLWPRALSRDEVAVLAGRDPVAELLALPAKSRTAEQARQLRKWYLESQDAEFRATTTRRDEVQRELTALQKSLPKTMVMEELPQPRATHILERGEYRRPKERVYAGVPQVLSELPPRSIAGTKPTTIGIADPRPSATRAASLNRLDLARWLFHPDHPLTARVAVNRLWQVHFGTGLARSGDDFGTHGEAPSHPELLDWLADEFRSTPTPWDMKRMQRLLVTSAVFQQSNAVTPGLLERDPENRLWARGPRFRLAAETLRDSALASSGLLVRRLGGPSVLPPQPAGLWEELAYDTQSFTAQKFQVSSGGDIYRRGIYTFWKRAAPYPVFSTFDAPDRETCVTSRSTSNSPLQALVLMNEPVLVESAVELARTATRSAQEPADRLAWMFRATLARAPRAPEAKLLLDRYTVELDEFTAHPASAASLVNSPSDVRAKAAAASVAELAALAVTASAILQLDEVLVP